MYRFIIRKILFPRSWINLDHFYFLWGRQFKHVTLNNRSNSISQQNTWRFDENKAQKLVLLQLYQKCPKIGYLRFFLIMKICEGSVPEH